MADKYWIGVVPTECDITKATIDHSAGGKFIDGATTMGPWACMTPESHSQYGKGLGTGRGQEYTKQADGRWLKTA